MIGLLQRLLRNERGSIVVIAVFAATAVFGMAALVVDAGMLYMNKVQLANTVDAAVLAGVQEMPAGTSSAAAVALDYASRNGKESDSITVTAPAADRLRVSGSRVVELFFAQALGFSTATVSASATASLVTYSGGTGCVPWGIEKQNFEYGWTYNLKLGAGDGYHGNFQALALGGNGASNYRDNIKYGYDGKLKVGDWVPTEPGNMSGPTSDGVEYRISQDRHATFDTVQKGSARIVVVPVIDSLEVNGRKDVLIVGFAAYFLEGVAGNGNKNYVTGKFLEMVASGDISPSAGDYGVYGVKLID